MTLDPMRTREERPGHKSNRHDPDPAARGLADLAYVAPIALLLLTLITVVIVKVGPTPHPATGSSELFPGHAALIEPRDRMVLLSWWLSVPILLGLVWILARLPRGRARLIGESLTLAGSVVVAVASALWFEEVDAGLAIWIPRLHAWELAVGVMAAVLAVGTLLAGAVWFRRVASAVLVIATLSFLLPAMVQTPTSIVEPYHAIYTLDELLAPAAGQVPLVDYFPMYVNLLGFPIAPLIQSWR
jgi:hypothetical protein